MDVFEAIQKRRSIRAYKDQPIPEETLQKILEAGRLAPSAANRQEYKFIVVRDKERKKELAAACNNQSFIGDAAVVIVGCTLNPERRYSFVDVAIALDHMTLVAASEGLGTCWIGAFSEEKVKALLNIPEKVQVVCILPIGVPAREGVPRNRKSKEELFPQETWA